LYLKDKQLTASFKKHVLYKIIMENDGSLTYSQYTEDEIGEL